MLNKIAFQGARGSFAEEAAFEFAHDDAEIVSYPTLADLRAAVETGAADCAVLPLENSLIGAVEVTNQFLAGVAWREIGRLYLPIQLNLIGTPDAELRDLKIVESHPAALAQCRRFFADYPQLLKVETDNTAASVASIVRNADRTCGAIAGARAAQIFGGKILLSDVQDKHENFTKFLLLKK